MKIDPYKHKERYLDWKEKVKSKGIKGLSQKNSNILIQYIFDMEVGINIASGSVKGGRSHIRLNNLKQRMVFLAKKFKERHNLDLEDLTEDVLFSFFNDMRNGTLQKKNGGTYKSVGDYVKIFKAFWHWYIKIKGKQGIEIKDISKDLDASNNKPKWVYLTENQVRQLYDSAKYKYKVLIMFLFDTGIRAPTELINLKVSDLYNDLKELHIRDKISKTFGRNISRI